MSVSSEITRLRQGISQIYTELDNLGADLPESRTIENIPQAIQSLNGKLNADTVDGIHFQIKPTAPTVDDTSIFTIVAKV